MGKSGGTIWETRVENRMRGKGLVEKACKKFTGGRKSHLSTRRGRRDVFSEPQKEKKAHVKSKIKKNARESPNRKKKV